MFLTMFEKTSSYFLGHPKKHRLPCQQKSILTMDKLLKITTVNEKILTLCKNFREKAVTWHALQKNGWMKMDVFHG